MPNRYVSDFRGSVTEIAPDGTQTFFGGQTITGFGLLKPNGIALLENGDFLIAHLGDTQGGIFRVERNGNCTPFILDIDGEPLPPSNFIYLDRQGRLWITVSTRILPRADAYRSDNADGYIAVVENGRARIVADNLGYTNELYVDPDGQHLYVNATFTRELIQYQIDDTNDLHNPKVIARFGPATFPDGLTRDTKGNFWVTSIVSNRVIKIAPDGNQKIILEDNDADHLAWVEEAFQACEMGRPHLDDIKSQKLKSISSLAFGGADLSTLHLGCLLGPSIATINSHVEAQASVTGIAPAHWHFDDHRC